MLTVHKISSFSEFKNCRHDWEDLLSRSYADNIFLTYEWIEACISYFCRGKKLLVLEIFEGEKLVGIAPMMVCVKKSFGLAARSVCFIGTDASDRMDFIADSGSNKEDIIRTALDYIIGIRDRWDVIDLQEIAEATQTIEIIKAYLKKMGFLNVLDPAKKSFFISMNGSKDVIFQEFSKKFYRKVKKINNKWPDVHFEFERHLGCSPEKMKSLFIDLKSIEGRSWQGEKNVGIFCRREGMSFHSMVFDTFSQNSLLDLSVLRLNKKPAAYIYNYFYNGRSYNYNIAFDKKYSNLSPGTVLMLWTIMDSAAKEVAEFDFARGEESWKNRLTQDFKIHNRIRIFNDSFYSKCLYYLHGKAVPAIKSRKILYRFYTRVKRGLRWK
ncbi:MAG: GNAT family N-acetyltransferase [Candidatus Omnitrophota bacterium]|nr:GNAT family N-acetyltransferase [Candidatus Omnitrophota bacterium]